MWSHSSNTRQCRRKDIKVYLKDKHGGRAEKQYQIKDQLGPAPIFWHLTGEHSNKGKHQVIFAPWLSLPYCGLWLRNVTSAVVSLPFTAFTDQCHSTIQFPAALGSSLALERLYGVLSEESSTCQCCFLSISFQDVQTMGIGEGLKFQLRKNGNILKICSEYFSYPCLWRNCSVFFPLYFYMCG